MGGRLPALDKQTATGTRSAPAPARGRPRVAEEFPHRRNCPTPQKEGRSEPLRTTQPGSGGSADHRGGAPCCAGPRLDGCAYQYESDQEVLGGRGSALGWATGHWDGQIAYPNSWFPTPMRVSRPNTARRTRKGSAAGNRSAKRTPPGARPASAVTGRCTWGERRPVSARCSQRWTGRCAWARGAHATDARSQPRPLGVSARSAASRSGTS